MVYLVCAREFGWTPEQTNKIDLYMLYSMLIALEEIKKKEERDIKAQH